MSVWYTSLQLVDTCFNIFAQSCPQNSIYSSNMPFFKPVKEIVMQMFNLFTCYSCKSIMNIAGSYVGQMTGKPLTKIYGFLNCSFLLVSVVNTYTHCNTPLPGNIVSPKLLINDIKEFLCFWCIMTGGDTHTQHRSGCHTHWPFEIKNSYCYWIHFLDIIVTRSIDSQTEWVLLGEFNYVLMAVGPMALLISAAVFVALQVYNLAVLLSMKIVVKSGGPRCAVVAIGGLCCIKKLVTITFAFMTSLDVEVAAGNNCAIGLFLSTSVTAAWAILFCNGL